MCDQSRSVVIPASMAPSAESRSPMYDVLRPERGRQLVQYERDVAGPPLQRNVGSDVAKEALPDVPMAIDEARHHDHARCIDHLGLRGHQTGTDLDDLVPLDQDVGGGEVTNVRVEAEHCGAPDQRPSRRHHPEVGGRGVEVGDLGRLRRAAADRKAARPLVVPFHQLLDVARLEEGDPEEDQNTCDHQAMLRAQFEEGERAEDQRQEHRRDRCAKERCPSPRQGGSTEHRSGDAAQRVAIADLRVPDP